MLASAVLLLILLAPLYVAQSPPAAGPTPQEVRHVDSPDDVKVVSPGAPSQNASATGQADTVDIRELWLGAETEKTFEVGIRMKALPPATGPPVTRSIYFDFDSVKYRIVSGQRGPGQDAQAQLQAYDQGVERYRTTQQITGTVDASTSSVTYTIPRDFVVNENHVGLRFGDSLQNISATASRSVVFQFPFSPTGASLFDRAPDDGFLPPFNFALGRVGAGLLALVADDPIRVSNGESTTIVYKVALINQGAEEVSVQLETQGLPTDWSARIPSLLDVKAKESVTFPVIVAVPFTHAHGETAVFTIRAEAVDDANTWSSAQLGVYWTQTPQPAGHHPDMWLHSAPADFDQDLAGVFGTAFPFRSAWINPLETDPEPGTDDADVPAFFNEELGNFLGSRGQSPPPSGTQWTTEWFLPLSPELLIGLDFDLARHGLLKAAVRHTVPASVTLEARLLYCDPDGQGQAINCTASFQAQWLEQPLASGKSDPRTVTNGEVVGYEIPLTVDASADFLTYKRGANIALHLVLSSDRPQNTLNQPRPELIIKGSEHAMLSLPLIEYHDPIDQAFENVGSLSLSALTPFEKKVNPGEVALFRLMLNNTGKEAVNVGLEIVGENIAWVSIIGETQFELPAGGAREIVVKAAPPADAADQDRAVVTLVAQSLDDATVVTVKKLLATAVKNEDIADESGQLSDGPKKDTPGVEAVTLSLSLLALASVSRRARKTK